MRDFTKQARWILDAIGADGAISAREIGEGRSLGFAEDQPVVLASVFKVPVLVELCRQIAAGEIDPLSRTCIRAADRTPGTTGLSAMLDDVELSVRDLALSMMSVSDNAATDAVMGLVGIPRIEATLHELGLWSFSITQTCADIYDVLATDAGAGSGEDLEAALADEEKRAAIVDRVRCSSVLDPAATNAATPGEVTRLFELIWTDRAGSAPACAEMRRILGQQVWPHRLRAGFPDSVTVAGKTGTLPFARSEAGVVQYPDGQCYAVAVFLRPGSGDIVLPDADRAIGRLGRLAVDTLRDDARR